MRSYPNHPKELPEDAFEWILALSASWIKDEDIGAETPN